MAEPCGYDVVIDRISHDIPFYRAWLKNAVLAGAHDHQQPVLVERGRQVLQLRAGDRSSGVAMPPTVALPHKEHPTGHHRPLDAQPALPARLGGHLRVRRVPGVPEAVRRRRLARRPQGELAGGVLPRLRPDARPVHDAAARGELQGVLPLLRRRAGEGAHHALRSAAAVPRALRQEPAGLRPGAAGARREGLRSRSAGRSATT